ncbi:MAG TPA: hypothetical protein VKH41_00630 [Myxococcota bacterium]|nr:hypothetical protein [Myxococcota bacterium]
MDAADRKRDGGAREVVVEPVDHARHGDEPARECDRGREDRADGRCEQAPAVRCELLDEQIDPPDEERLAGLQHALERVAETRIQLRAGGLAVGHARISETRHRSSL